MKGTIQIAAVVVGGLALLALRGEAGEVRGQDDVAARVEALEQKVTELEALNEELATAVGTSRALVDEITAYLEEQSKSAAAMTEVLAESEKLGFTAGINFNSREVMLKGWRARLKAIQEDLPGGQQKKAAATNGRRPRR